MSNSTTVSTSTLIDSIRNILLATFGTTAVIIGTVGNLFNILLFTRPAVMRQSPCILYLLSSSITAFLVIYSTVLTRALLGFHITPLYYSRVLCKLNAFCSYFGNVSVTWFMVSACCDRYLSSSSDAIRRNMSNKRNVRRVICVILFLTILICIETLYCYDSGNVGTIVPCTNQNAFCTTLDVVLVFVVQYFIPLFLTVYFGFGVLFNVKRISRQIRANRIPTITNPITRILNRSDMIMMRVVLIQIAVLSVCAFPSIGSRIYQLASATTVKDDVRRSIENLLTNIILLVYSTDKVCSFYIYTLNSAHLRRQFKKTIISLYRRNTVEPQL